ncbi:hypothetical protein ACN4EG_27720 [Alkalinema pantanalense CENA528]|uniref:hypothetical protein n=1 Tax=Alkalinema pantanalense TaxID=1620705 RepID=UPI003D6DEC36
MLLQTAWGLSDRFEGLTLKAIALVFRAYQQQDLNLRLLLNYSNVAAIAVPVNRRGWLSFVARLKNISKLQISSIAQI